MRRLGHSSITTTVNVYGHVTPDADNRACELMDRRLPEVLARDDNNTVVTLSTPEQALPVFDIDDDDDLAA